jgi:hypothetical protein
VSRGDPSGRPFNAMGRLGHLLILCLALTAAGCAPRSIYDLDPSQIDRNERIQLHFDWPTGMVADVRSFITKSQTVDKVATTKSVEVRCQLHTESAEHGIRVLCENTTLEGDDTLKMFLDGAPGLLAHPVLTVGADGTISQIGGLEGVPGALKQALAGDPELSPNARGAIEVLSDPKTLDHVARQEWWNLVAFWNGKTLQTGTTYDLSRAATVPIYGDTIDWHQHYTLAGRVPCNEEDHKRKCVKLVLISTPDSVQFSQAVKAIMTSAAGPHMHRSSRDVVLRKVQYHYTLVTLPDRLMPYWVEDRRSMQLQTTGEDGTSETMDVVEERQDSYTYIATGMEKYHLVQ